MAPTPSNNNRIYIYDNIDSNEGPVIDDKRLSFGRCLVVVNKEILRFKRGDKLVMVEAFSRAIGLMK